MSGCDDLYHVTLGDGGLRAAGPYRGYEVACRARDGMTRTLRMILRRQYYWVEPVPASPALRDAQGGRE